ncbi:NAD-dependent epimerase/dehydratase family protein [Bosea sp. R86505]|uniref:NAD-dependent epimerase/dehydratase family protein n=1 Tax=Bosea sp. R86505 TaxID=3101710 RepID=UPI00367027F8
MPTVMLTGPSGFLGSHLLYRLLREPEVRVHAVARTGTGRTHERLTWHRGDLLEPGLASRLMAEIRPTHLLHNAWFAVPGRFWSDPSNLAWLRASVDLMAAFAAASGQRFVGVGTCAEYDWTGTEPYAEDRTPIRPATLYGKAKAACWAAAQVFEAAGSFQAAWGRIFLPYGPGDTTGRLLPSLMCELRAGRPMSLGDGSLERDFIYAADAADLLVRMLMSQANGAFNVASGQATTLQVAIDHVADRLGRRDLLRFGERPTPVNEPSRLVADPTKVRETLGWTPQTSLLHGLDTVLQSSLQGHQ